MTSVADEGLWGWLPVVGFWVLHNYGGIQM